MQRLQSFKLAAAFQVAGLNHYVAAAALMALPLYYAVISLWLGLSLTRSMPVFDQVVIALDYFRVLDGKYSLLAIFDLHNEHRIPTTRLVLFADAWLFSMAGYLPTVISYAAMGGTAWLIASQATTTDTTLTRTTVFYVALALFWSTMNRLTLGVGMQIGFAFVHLFAVATFYFFSRGKIALACIADALAVFSLGSGPFTAAPVIAIAVWRRSLDRRLCIFLAVHAALCVAYFISFKTKSEGFDVGDAITATAGLVGWIAAPMWQQINLGFGLLAVSLIALIIATWRAVFLRRTIDPTDCVLLAAALFALIEASAAGLIRSSGAGPRFATFSTVLVCSLLALAWRHGGGARSAVAVTALAAIVLANAPDHERDWRKSAARIDTATVTLLRNERPESVRSIVWPPEPGTSWMDYFIDRMQAERLGPFR